MDGLTRALAQRRLGVPEYALERAQALFDPAAAERRFGPLSRPGSFEATAILRDLALRVAQLPANERQRAARLLDRPTAGAGTRVGYSVPEAPPVCSEHFCVHYVMTSQDAPPLNDVDGDGIPDEVDETSAVLEHVWQVEVGELGYRAPESDLDSPEHGPDGRLDVYLANIGQQGYFGLTATDDPGLRQHPDGPFDASAYCILDNDYSAAEFAPAATGLAALEVTAAHEVFHAIQFAYNYEADLWMLEGTAVWMEDQVYDDVNDNRNYLADSPLAKPRLSLDRGYEPSSWIFWRFLSEWLGSPEVVRRTWEYADGSPGGPDEYSLEAISSMLAEHSATFAAAFARFAAVNVVPAAFYREGAAYPSPPLGPPRTPKPSLPWSGQAKLGHLSTRYFSFAASRTSGTRLRISFELPRPADGATATLVLLRSGGGPGIVPVNLNRRGEARATVPFDRSKLSRVVLVLSNASMRFSCGRGTQLSCGGVPLDDGELYRFQVTVLRAKPAHSRR